MPLSKVKCYLSVPQCKKDVLCLMGKKCIRGHELGCYYRL